MKRIMHFITIAALSCPLGAGQLTLYECYDKAVKTHPVQREYRNRRLIYDLNLRNLNTGWLPSLEANASATYLSDSRITAGSDFNEIAARHAPRSV